LPRKCHLHTMLSGHFFLPPLQYCMPSFAPPGYVPKLGVRPLIF
jgi:hypothetical protein